MLRTRILVLVMVAMVAMHMGFPASATTVLKFSDQDLVRQSSIVAEGRVIDVRGEWNSNRTQIFTTVTIGVSATLKGATPANGRLVIRQLGGTVDDMTLHIAGQPVFTVDEDVIVFVSANARGMMPVTGLSQGKFTVAIDASGQRIVTGRGTTRDSFVSEISRMVEDQKGAR